MTIERGWQDIATAPRDGSPVWLCDELGDAGGPFPMRWDANRTSWAQPQRGLGIWTMEGGGATWSEEHPDGSPTHWAPRTSEDCPTPPWKTKH